MAFLVKNRVQPFKLFVETAPPNLYKAPHLQARAILANILRPRFHPPWSTPVVSVSNF